MKQLILLFSFVLLSSMTLHAQESILKGKINDTLNKENLSNAVISLLRAKDSVLVKFTRSDTEGNFEIKSLAAGNYLMMVTYPGYAAFADTIGLASGIIKNVGVLPLITKANLLQEVIVRQSVAAIRVKGDTTEYKADSFHVSANADVQELLKKMPGIQVNSRGEISTQGEKVNKVLVDGEEFFSDDPAVVTKNLRADAIDKVQVFDKKSDQAVFTGIDDGQKQKTINLQLKEDKKKGFFGKLEAGSDMQQYNTAKLMANAFKGKRKIAGYITADNTKFETLSWDENRNYAGDPNTVTTMTDDGGIMMTGTSDDFSWGQGLPTSHTAGLHFSNKWNNDKNNSNNTYQFNNLQVTGNTTSYTENILPDSNIINSTRSIENNRRTRHKLTSVNEWQIDSSSSIKLTLRASDVKSEGNRNYAGKSFSASGRMINISDRNTTNANDSKDINGSIFWRKKFVKKGRTISLNSDFSFSNKTDDGLLLAKNQYFDKFGNQIRLDNIDQKKMNDQSGSTINTNLTYTEPLWKNTFLLFNYRMDINKNDAQRDSYSKDPNGQYQSLIDSLSNHFIFNTLGNTGGINIRYNTKKFNFNIGSGLGTVNYQMNDLRKHNDRNVSFTNFVPSVLFNYTPKQQRRLMFSYNGSTQNPTLNQIQPLIDNTDPMNISIGNSNLKQAFNHRFNVRASDYKVLKSRSIYMDMNYSATDNAITSSSYVDSIGRRVNQSVNVNGNFNYRVYAGYDFEIMPSLRLGASVGPNFSRYINYVNGIRNQTDNRSTSIGINSGYYSEKWINFWINLNANHNNSVSSIRPGITTSYWSYSSWSNLEFKFKKLKLFTELNGQFNIYQKTAAFANQQDAYIINWSIRKIISKNEKWETKFYVNDLFNQNVRINRNISSNFISETSSENVRRYFMLSLTYNFSKNGKPSSMGF